MQNIRLFCAAFFILAAAFIAAPACAEEVCMPQYEWSNQYPDANVSVTGLWKLSDGNIAGAGKTADGRTLFILDGETGMISDYYTVGGDRNGELLFVQESSDKNLIVYTESADLMKITPKGEVLWTYHLPYGVAASIETDGSDQTLMSYDFFQSSFLAVDSDGKEIWNGTVNAKSGGLINVKSIQKSENGYIVAGFVDPVMYTESYTGFAAEIDTDGNVLWSQEYKNGNNSVLFYSVAPLKNGKAAVAALEGRNTNETEINEDGEEEPIFDYTPYIVMLGVNGTAEEKIQVSGAETVRYIIQADDGGFYLFGLSTKFAELGTEDDNLIIRTDKDGNTQWIFGLGSIIPTNIVLADDGIIFAGKDEKTGLTSVQKLTNVCTQTSGAGAAVPVGALIITLIAAFALRRK